MIDDILSEKEFEEKIKKLIEAATRKDQDQIEKLFEELINSYSAITFLAWS